MLKRSKWENNRCRDELLKFVKDKFLLRLKEVNIAVSNAKQSETNASGSATSAEFLQITRLKVPRMHKEQRLMPGRYWRK